MKTLGPRGLMALVLLMTTLVVFRTAPADLAAQGAAALSGVVSSQEEGKMEGVLVNARPEGGNFTVSVVSDKDGRYSFPRTHLSTHERSNFVMSHHRGGTASGRRRNCRLSTRCLTA